MRTIAIGDIHGCNTALVCLLNNVRPAAGDRVVFLGDYIDRGPASREVIDTLLHLTCSPIFLRGNHEVMILEAREDPLKAKLWQSYGGLEALFSYGANYQQDWISAIPDSHWAFFERTVKYFETEMHIFVHACLDPNLDLKAEHSRLTPERSTPKCREKSARIAWPACLAVSLCGS